MYGGPAQPPAWRHTQLWSSLATRPWGALAAGVRMEQQRLTLAATGKQLLDILCLADYPQITSGAPNAVTVAVA